MKAYFSQIQGQSILILLSDQLHYQLLPGSIEQALRAAIKICQESNADLYIEQLQGINNGFILPGTVNVYLVPSLLQELLLNIRSAKPVQPVLQDQLQQDKPGDQLEVRSVPCIQLNTLGA